MNTNLNATCLSWNSLFIFLTTTTNKNLQKTTNTFLFQLLSDIQGDSINYTLIQIKKRKNLLYRTLQTKIYHYKDVVSTAGGRETGPHPKCLYCVCVLGIDLCWLTVINWRQFMSISFTTFTETWSYSHFMENMYILHVESCFYKFVVIDNVFKKLLRFDHDSLDHARKDKQ